MAGINEFHEARFLRETLKEQVSVSIREALEKTTSVLSNLHRVQSYLDLIKSVPISRSEAGAKNALEQIRMVREDAATLLQTVCLSEIGLQSLQNYDRQGGASTDASSMMPIFGDTINITPTVPINSNDPSQDSAAEGLIMGLSSADDSLSFVDPSGSVESSLPPAKKPKLGVSVVSCSSCRRRFAAQQSSNGSGTHLCRNCKSGHSSENQQPPATHSGGATVMDASPQTPLNAPSSSSSSLSPSSFALSKALTPRVSSSAVKSGRRNKLTPMTCKICNTCFLYRRCLLRHLRENHNVVDLDTCGLSKYVEYGQAVDGSIAAINLGDVSKSASVSVTVGSDGNDDITVEGENTTAEEEATLRKSGEDSPLSGTPPPQIERNTEGGGGGDIIELANGEYTCPVCGKCFKRPYRLQRHLQIHDPNRPRVQCHICDRSFTRTDTLENHIKCLHSEEKPFECMYENCFKSFATQSTLLHHVRAHTDGRPYKCIECDATFGLLNEYKQHVTSLHSDTKDLRCAECFKVFPVSEDLEEHKLLEHRFECELCSKVFARLSYLETHVQVHSGDNLFNCRFCGSGFEDEYNYRNHVKIHPEYTNKGRRAMSYTCQACNVSFHQPNELMVHYRSEDHRSKASSLGLGNSLVLQTIEGELSDDVSALVDEVTMATGGDEDSIIQTLTSSEAFQSVAVVPSIATAMGTMVTESTVHSFPESSGGNT